MSDSKYRLLLTLLLAAPAFGQQAPVPLEEIASAAVSKSGGTPGLDSQLAPLAGMQLESSKDSTRATMKLAKTVASTLFASGTYSSFSMVLGAPLNKESPDSALAYLSGSFVNASTLEVTYTHARIPGFRISAFTDADADRLDAICERVKDRMRSDGLTVPASGCDYSQVTTYGSQQDINQYERMFFNDQAGGNTFWGANLKFGYQDFDYVDPLAVQKRKQNELPFEAGAFFAYNPQDTNRLLSLGLKYQEGYKDARSGVLCPPITDATKPNLCLSGAIGRPSYSEKKIVSFEFRQGFAGMGLALVASRDFENDVTAVDLPIYFIADAKQNLNGGLKLSWDDDKKDVVASFFVGSTFAIFK